MERLVVAVRRVGFNPPNVRDGGLAPTLRLRRASHLARQERGIWQRRYWEHHIRGPEDLSAHVRYCWRNPVKHGFVDRPEDWPHSSVHRDISEGRFEP